MVDKKQLELGELNVATAGLGESVKLFVNGLAVVSADRRRNANGDVEINLTTDYSVPDAPVGEQALDEIEQAETTAAAAAQAAATSASDANTTPFEAPSAADTIEPL